MKEGFIRSSSEGGFSLKRFPLGLERNMLLLENSRVRLAAPQDQLGAEQSGFQTVLPSWEGAQQGGAPVTQEILERPGILGLEVLVETKIPAQLSEDTEAKCVPVTQAAHCK